MAVAAVMMEGTGTEGPLLELRDMQQFPAVMCRYWNYRDSYSEAKGSSGSGGTPGSCTKPVVCSRRGAIQMHVYLYLYVTAYNSPSYLNLNLRCPVYIQCYRLE